MPQTRYTTPLLIQIQGGGHTGECLAAGLVATGAILCKLLLPLREGSNRAIRLTGAAGRRLGARPPVTVPTVTAVDSALASVPHLLLPLLRAGRAIRDLPVTGHDFTDAVAVGLTGTRSALIGALLGAVPLTVVDVAPLTGAAMRGMVLP